MSPAAPREACQSSWFRLLADEIADWFATLARAEKTHARRFKKGLDPTAHQLTATLFIELSDVQTVRAELARLDGIQHTLRLEAGSLSTPGIEVPGPDEEDGVGACLPTVSVHMLGFPLGDGARAALLDLDVTVELVVEHPEYADAVPLSADLRSDLAADLGGDGS